MLWDPRGEPGEGKLWEEATGLGPEGEENGTKAEEVRGGGERFSVHQHKMKAQRWDSIRHAPEAPQVGSREPWENEEEAPTARLVLAATPLPTLEPSHLP